MKALFAVLLLATVAQGQKISPLQQEFKNKANGQFTVGNVGLQPLTVNISFASFDVDPHGHNRNMRPLDPGIAVTVKKPSFTLGPRATDTVDFNATCATQPCRFLIYSNFQPPHVQGLNVAFHLGTAVYVCSDKQKNCRRQQLASMGYFPPK